MTASKHQWVNVYRPETIARMSIANSRPGSHIVSAINEIQSAINDVQTDQGTARTNWGYRISAPRRNETITGSRPGQWIHLSLADIQSILNSMEPAADQQISDNLIASYSEHRQVVGQGAYTTPDTDAALFEKHQWKYPYKRPVYGQIIKHSTPGHKIAWAITEIQEVVNRLEGLEKPSDILAEMDAWQAAYCVQFLDGTFKPDGVTFNYYTIDTFQSARATGGSTLADVIAGFNILTNVGKSVAWSRENPNYGTGDEFFALGPPNWNQSEADAEAGFLPTSGPNEYWPTCWSYKYYYLDSFLYSYDVTARILRVSSYPTTTAAVIPHVVKLYLAAAEPWGTTYPGGSETDFTYDDQGSGIAESATYTLFSTSGTETAASWTGALIGGDLPLVIPDWCDDPPVVTWWGSTSKGYGASGVVIIEYQFTTAS